MISVCIATYNGEKYIKEQLNSILNQISENDEVIISDDHSTDDTIKIAKEIGDDRIKIYYNPIEKGYAKNFENAIKKSIGDIIFLSDQDDVWLENKVQITMSYLKTYDLVISDATHVNEFLETTIGSHFKISKMKSGFLRHLLKPSYIGACMAFKRRILKKALPFPENSKYCAHDYWLTLIGEFYYKVGLIEQELILYRRHDSNASPAGKKSPNSFLKKITIRIYSITQLFLRII